MTLRLSDLSLILTIEGLSKRVASLAKIKKSVQSQPRRRNWTLLVLTACEYLVEALPNISQAQVNVSLVHELQIQDLLKDGAEDAGGPVGITAVLRAAVVAVFLAAIAALTEVILILAQVDVVAVMTIAAVLIGDGVLGTL